MQPTSPPTIRSLGVWIWRDFHRGAEPRRTRKDVESPEGVSPSGAPRTVHDPLESHGSRCSAVAMTEGPVDKEFRRLPAEPVEPVSAAPGLMNHPLVLATGPSNDIGIDPLQRRPELRLVEVAVVGDPAADGRIVHPGQLFQGFVTAVMQRPSPDLPADAHKRLGTGGRLEAVREDAALPRHPHDLPGPELA